MPVWQWLLDARRARAAPRPALRPRPRRPTSAALPPRRHLRAQLPRPLRAAGRGWLLGSVATPGESLEWFRIFSLSPRPKRVWAPRPARPTSGRRAPAGPSRCRSTPTTWWSVPATPTVSRRARDERGLADGLPVLAGGRPSRHRPRCEPSGDVRCPQRGRARRSSSTASVFASLVSRIPDVRVEPRPRQRRARPAAARDRRSGRCSRCRRPGRLINAWGTGAVVRVGARRWPRAGMLAAALGLGPRARPAARSLGLFVYGVGIGVWDVAMNVEGAEVERGLAARSCRASTPASACGTVVGAAARRAADRARRARCRAPGRWSLRRGRAGAGARRPAFLPGRAESHEEHRDPPARAWREPRTLLIGVMVLAFALTEGTANDWLAVALIDGYDVSARGRRRRLRGLRARDDRRPARSAPACSTASAGSPCCGRTMALAGVGVLLLVLRRRSPCWSWLGIVLWGVGASLGFPVGMSAAADDPVRAAARVSVVSTIGYAAFLAGPPLLGFVGDRGRHPQVAAGRRRAADARRAASVPAGPRAQLARPS